MISGDWSSDVCSSDLQPLRHSDDAEYDVTQSLPAFCAISAWSTTALRVQSVRHWTPSRLEHGEGGRFHRLNLQPSYRQQSIESGCYDWLAMEEHTRTESCHHVASDVITKSRENKRLNGPMRI